MARFAARSPKYHGAGMPQSRCVQGGRPGFGLPACVLLCIHFRAKSG